VLLCIHGRCSLSRFGDCSYGLYLWGFPIQQTVVHFVPDISPVSLFGVAGSITLVCALLSWHGIEKAALRRRIVTDRLIREWPGSKSALGVAIAPLFLSGLLAGRGIAAPRHRPAGLGT
jgi:peptidoglycan/LPS O-acetylase OafA/YrhL